jgi:hypothetical protein
VTNWNARRRQQRDRCFEQVIPNIFGQITRKIVMTELEIKRLGGGEASVSASTTRTKKDRRISVGTMLALCAIITSGAPARDAVALSSDHAAPPKVAKVPSKAAAAKSGDAAAQAEITIPVLPRAEGNALTGLVANGCEMPLLSKTRQAFYVDPVHGDINNDGSQAHPWDTLANVLARKMSVIKGGDVIYLLDGNHGRVVAANVNTDFVEVMPAPGQTPVLASLSVQGAKWLFTGLKIQGLAGAKGPGLLVSISGGWKTPKTSNIIISNNIINSQDDVNDWTREQWIQNAAGGINVDGRGGTNCITITGNKISGVRKGAGISADQSLFAYNHIDHFGNDGINYGGNDLTLSNNKITNVIDVGDGEHLDCMQGFQPGGAGYDATRYTNVTIDSNICIRQTRIDLNLPTYFQGINNFSSAPLDWYDLKVTNNVVITNHPHGITFGSIHNALIANNTVLNDGATTKSNFDTPNGPVMATVAGGATWILMTSVNNGTQGHPSDHVVVRQNIAQTLSQGPGTDPTVSFEDNISSLQVALFLNGKMEYYKMPGIYGHNNVLTRELNAGFTVFEPAHFDFDLRLKPTSVAKGYGSTLPVVNNPTHPLAP